MECWSVFCRSHSSSQWTSWSTILEVQNCYNGKKPFLFFTEGPTHKSYFSFLYKASPFNIYISGPKFLASLGSFIYFLMVHNCFTSLSSNPLQQQAADSLCHLSKRQSDTFRHKLGEHSRAFICLRVRPAFVSISF